MNSPKTFLWHPTKIKLTIALFLNPSCVLNRVQCGNFYYYWVVSTVNHVNVYRYANIRMDAMGTHPKPSFGIQLK